ncbi:biotin carboxylase [uncultured Microscilla sp.]|uniref:biotin carboxylase n=1 Tax=uncultured Microscilla sp. TaxID=432653 RepID=UPI0026083E1A|nr:biotin carboxylase [uncultured Microscilla sp.]
MSKVDKPENPITSKADKPENPTASKVDKPENPTANKVDKPKNPTANKVGKPENPTANKVDKPENPTANKVDKTKKPIKSKVEKPKNSKLKGISDIRRFFFKNEEPIYFISATNFNLLGADEWIKGFKFICHIECFDSLHPNVFSPKEEMPHDEFESIEDINNYLLQHPEVQAYIRSRKVRGKAGKVMFLMFNEKTEKLAKKLGLEVIFPSAKMRNLLDNKVNTNRIAEKAGVPCVPYVLSPVKDYKHLGEVSEKALGTDLVIQTPFGDSGHTTFFISNEEEYLKHAEEIEQEDEVKVMKRINCRGSAIEACVTKNGTIVAPLMTELVGFKELTPYKGGWCGNEVYPDAFTPGIRQKTRKYTKLFGDQLKKEGYKGYFELDFLIDQDNGEVYLGELNPRVTGASSITNHALFALADAPLYLFHILEWMNHEYEFSVNALNDRWAKQEYIDGWSQMVVKHTEDTVEYVHAAPRSGIWRMFDNGHIQFNRMDTHRRAVESDNEAFFLRITKKGDYLYEGADMGILVSRGRMMTNDFKLTPKAKGWINAIKSQYSAEMVEDKRVPVMLAGSLTK